MPKVFYRNRCFELNHIELFAGCGGLGLGLASAGFQLVMANELSPMAAETFSYNFFGEDLRAIADGMAEKPYSNRTKWLSSRFEIESMSDRLRENPHEYPHLGQGVCDINSVADLDGSLVVGSVVSLNGFVKKDERYLEALRNCFGRGELDLVSGGPPCQSFSLAGLRQRDNDRNSLPWEMVKFVDLTRPKVALLENVTGILRPFKKGGEEVYTWFEVAKAFAGVGYVPLCLHVNAKYAGVAQNRPRFIMLALRSDIYEKLELKFNRAEKKFFNKSWQLYRDLMQGFSVSFGCIECYDVERSDHLSLFEDSFLSYLVSFREDIRTVKDAIDDLKMKPSSPSFYVSEINSIFSFIRSSDDIKNHDMRRNGAQVKRRFRIYQVLEQLDKSDARAVKDFLSGKCYRMPSDVAKRVMRFDFLDESGHYKYFKDKLDLELFMRSHSTKKRTQKALSAALPAPAALSIPDDTCHYDHDEIRTLSVREMARIQSFPDGFVFRSKITTGGQQRKYEVPQYTQVGNAVPPLLGKALGLAIKDLIKRID